MRKHAENYVNYQDRAKEFSVGDIVAPYGMLENWAGRVTAVQPGIGMVDVETPAGNKRYPAEGLQRFEDGKATPPYTNSAAAKTASTTRVIQGHIKKALYWVGADRRYCMTKGEQAGGTPFCPRCDGELPLKHAIYKRLKGKSVRLLGCQQCLFLIRRDDIINFGLNKKRV